MAHRKVISDYTDEQVRAWVAAAMTAPLGEGEFTIRSLADQNGITQSVATGMVKRALADKEVRYMLSQGKPLYHSVFDIPKA